MEMSQQSALLVNLACVTLDALFTSLRDVLTIPQISYSAQFSFGSNGV
jgi:hypothetical protein